ncbi:hypothetical protein OGAPHI_005367 [Ogataea philodendri]|uniref:Rab-GAP TBC domain-containing protein n=1 Tax=Ogataea philodendri TaxID=1378263 RepID=A0A9P8P1A0_9ASCO|nr:uncharacterized protein OGAPHI_005367 [Ogataea philodendri]KAH3663377.1 hypothetical protein OGAPHI_005367 [Ogataea philodendri]
MSLPSLLEVIQESFEDVALDSAPLRARSVRSAPRQKLLPNCTLSAQDTNSQVNLLITPSQRLRLNQKKRTRTAEMLHGSDMVDAVDFLSDDELPDDLIVYNVPYSRPLKSLAQRDQAYRPSRMRPLRISRSASSVSSFGSPQTRASSIFSISSDCSELSLLEDEAKFSDEARLLGLNEDPQINESLQRISMLNSYKHVSAPNVSKEKLGYLTVTRQTNLPPKDPREASKHTRDYEQLLQSQMDKEQKKLEERKKQLAALAKQTDIDRKTWRTVLRDYDALVCSAETRELWWRGVPKDLRPRVWIRQMGRSSLSTEQTQQYLSEADEIIDKACDLKVAKLDTAQFARDNSKNYTLIESVEEYSALIQQAFPNLLVFQYGQAFDSILRTILAFRLCQRESTDPLFREIKVSHLVNLICVLYYNLRDETLTLRMFTSLMSKKMMYHLQTDTNLEYLQDIVAQFDKFLAKTSPNIHQHFEHIGLQPQLILAPTVSNIFSKMLNMDICSRLVDIYIFEGDTFLLRVLLALIRKVQYKLLGTKEEVCTILGDDCLSLLNRSKVSGYRYLDVGDATEFICDVRTILRRQGSS